MERVREGQRGIKFSDRRAPNQQEQEEKEEREEEGAQNSEGQLGNHSDRGSG